MAIGIKVTVTPIGLVIHKEMFFFGASPDRLITDADDSVGVLEITCPPSWSKLTIKEACTERGYPLAPTVSHTSSTGSSTKLIIKYNLKKNHAWYSQIQFALYCCNDIATFANLALFHVHAGAMHIERNFPDNDWFSKNIIKFDTFYKNHVIPFILRVQVKSPLVTLLI